MDRFGFGDWGDAHVALWLRDDDDLPLVELSFKAGIDVEGTILALALLDTQRGIVVVVDLCSKRAAKFYEQRLVASTRNRWMTNSNGNFANS